MEYENLKNKNDFFEVLFDSMDTIIFTLNEKHEILKINKAFTKILNLTIEEVFLKKYFDLFNCINFKNSSYCETYCNKCRTPDCTNEDLIFVYKNKFTNKNHYFTFKNKGLSSFEEKMNFVILNEVTSLVEKNSKLENLCSMDDLTGLYNRRFIINRLNDEIKLSNRYRENLSIIILDIDNFKEINDTLGHLVGDKILVQTAKIIEKSLRDTDCVGRIGGEEFIVILPKTDLEHAYLCAERIRKNIFDYKYEDYIKNVSISGGISCYDYKQTVEDMIRNADILLYKAKNSGRNKIAI